MKKIKLKICDPYLGNKFYLGTFFLTILNKYYEVELSENPDYVIYGDSTYEYLKYDCIRILNIGENISPNFNLCDYAIGYDYLTFQDRYFRMPVYLTAQYYNDAELSLADSLLERPWLFNNPDFTKAKPFTKEDLSKKTGFCSFVYSNYLASTEREKMFNLLSEYKRVDAGGAHLNNLGGRVKSKLAFELQHKFSIAFENSSRSGYTTEKFVNALVARTIPIYWGNPDIGKEFNEKRFINCHAYKNFDEIVERVKEIDRNDELYLRMINEPIAASGVDFSAYYTGLEKFLQNIFDQPIAQAKRRTINPGKALYLEANERLVARNATRKFFLRKFLAFFYKPFKRFVFLEQFKQKFLANRVHQKTD